MSKAVGKFKNLKELGKKITTKVGGFLNKAGKFMDKVKPIVDVVTDFIPNGDKIDEVYDMVTDWTKKGAKVVEKVSSNYKSIKPPENLPKSKPIPYKTPSGDVSFGTWDNSHKPNPKQKTSGNKSFSFLSNKLN